MSLTLGKTDIESITGKVELFTPADNGIRKKAGTLKVTTRVLPRSEFAELTESAEDDLVVVKAMLLNIEAADKDTTVPTYSADLLDEIFEIDWQFDPLLDFVIAANSHRLGRAMKAKN